MASPKPYASVSEESSDVQVLDSNEALVLPCVLSALEEPVSGPSGVAAGSSGSLPVTASSSEDEDEDDAPPVPRPTGSTGLRKRPNSDELKLMWNWNKFFSKLGTHDQCVQFAEEKGLIPTLKLCSYHKSAMTLTKESGQVGKFRYRKSKCRTKTVSRSIGTWFENSRLSLTLIFQMMYAFSEGLTYNQTRKELCSEDCPVLSTRTVAD
ncbi:hypothetical protein HW555_011923 [Spodoptera exigua]|uniref:Uncharacterized protein n=1 Tax=Spodoptera exigua TaxID=7107 RepID=A0A835G6W6_SPOEX|nr:hypothetical protein HW555_011923 [Spodoptera exigua]